MNERTAYEKLSVGNLRKIAAERSIGSGVWRAGASKAALVAALCGEEVPTEVDGPGSPEPAQALQGLAAVLEGMMTLKGSLDENRVREIVSEAIQGLESPKIRIEVAGSPEIEIDRQHALFLHLLMALKSGCHVYLAGPAGSGKTTAAEESAKALGLEFSCQSFGPQTMQSALLGYPNAHGVYVESEFRRRFEHGGVYVFDEMDNASSHVVTVLNSALANGYCAFPDKMVKRHPDFLVVACANTFGQGGDRQYLRNQLDAATLDRFAFIEWGYDEAFEAALVGASCANPHKFIAPEAGARMTPQEWFDRVRAIRAAVADLKLRMVVSPRATILGTKLFSVGFGRWWVEEMLIWKGTDAGTRTKIEANIKN